MSIELDIIIVNYFSEKLVQKCVNSIINTTNRNCHIIVVDNGSNTRILDNLNSQKITLIRNKENLGFGHACNIGAVAAKGDNLLFLNPDTTMYDNTLDQAIDFVKSMGEIWVLGCQQLDEKGNILKTCARFTTYRNYLIKILALNAVAPKFFKGHRMLEWDHNSSRFVDHVMGSFYLIKRDVFEKLGGFDEDYFVYYEDLDLSKRIHNMGGKILFNKDLRIYHETGGVSKNILGTRLYYSLDGFLIYAKKHFGKAGYYGTFITVLFLEPIIRLTISIFRLRIQDTKNIMKAYNLLYKKRIFAR